MPDYAQFTFRSKLSHECNAFCRTNGCAFSEAVEATGYANGVDISYAKFVFMEMHFN